jgi:hypothetical protein
MFLVQLVAIPNSLASNPLGTNLELLTYSSTNFPFLNIVKECGTGSASGPVVPWFTGIAPADTGEELLLNLDSDGYPLTIPQAGLTSKAVYCAVFRSPTGALAPGQTSYYPAGSYTVQFSGAGTVTISGDASASISTSGGTFTVSNPGNYGLIIAITASTAGNHLHNLSIVQTSLVSSFNSGAIFHPTFLATVQNYKSFRFMEWKNAINQAAGVTFTAAPSAGATSLSLSTAWNYPSGTYSLYFYPASQTAPQSESKAATFTAGSTSVTWTGGLISNGYQSYGGVDVHYPWAKRALPSNVNYTGQDGVPIEVALALCNTVGANCWLNIPLTYSDSDIQSFAALVINGTGAQSGYSALNSGLNFYVELSNEIWNSGNQNYYVAGVLGYQLWGAAQSASSYFSQNSFTLNWYAMKVAQMASDLQTALGSSFSRCIPIFGAQAGNTTAASYSLSAPFWTTGTGPPSSYPIKAIAIAPYFGGGPSSADATTMTGVATPLDDFFATLYSQTGTSANGGHVYSSIPSGGWLGAVEAQFINPWIPFVASYPGMTLVAYEGGQSFYPNSSGTAPGWPALVTSAQRDPRMATAYTNYLNYWKTNVGATSANIFNVYTDVDTISVFGAWGTLESVMQPISPLSSAPPKFQGIQNYIGTINIPMPPTNLVVH